MALVYRYGKADAAGGGNGLSWDTAWTFAEVIANGAAGMHVYWRGDITLNAATTLPAGTVGSPFILEGCKTVAGDGYLGRLNQGALIETNMPVLTYAGNYNLVGGANYVDILNLKVVGASTAYQILNVGIGSNVINCIVENSANGYGIGVYNSYSAAINCDVYLTNSSNSNVGIAGFKIIGCRISRTANATPAAISLSDNGTAIGNVIIKNTGGPGIIFGGAIGAVVKNTFYNCAYGVFTRNNTAQCTAIHENIFSTCGYALYNPYKDTAAHPLLSVNNLYYNIANANLGFGDWPEIGRIDAATDPFIDAANGDLRLKRTSEAVNAATNGGDIGGIQRPAYWPVVTDLRSGTSVDGVTGTLDLPAITDVQEGVTFDGATKTGTFVSPSEDDVRLSTSYGASAEFTGNLVLPSESTVQDSVQYGTDGTEYTGTYILDVPDEDNVRSGITYDSGNSTGNMTLPAISNVKNTIQYGANGTEYTGNLVLPSEDNVRESITFGSAAEYTGNIELPAVEDVQLSVQYGSNGTELTGTYDLDFPATGDVVEGVSYGNGDYTGTFEVPLESNVRVSIQFGENGTEYTGTYELESLGELTYIIFYTKNGTPETGLSPTIDIFKLVSNNTDVASPPTITEIGGGFYKFSYSTSDAIVARIDSNDETMPVTERYKVLQISKNDDIISTFFNETITASGNISFIDIMKYLYGMAKGKIVKTDDTFTFYDDDNETVLYSFTISETGRI